MTDIKCGICWRSQNLTPDQQGDPANRITGTIRLCAKHQAVQDDWADRWGHLLIEAPTATISRTFLRITEEPK